MRFPEGLVEVNRQPEYSTIQKDRRAHRNDGVDGKALERVTIVNLLLQVLLRLGNLSDVRNSLISTGCPITSRRGASPGVSFTPNS